MNKTVNINLAGIFFHIDEDAYAKLQHYLNAIKHSFTNTQGREEILADIEARIAELFNEKKKDARQVISTKEVEEVIAIMGQPEDYVVDEEIFEDEPVYTRKTTGKLLFRDTENSYISGVSSGFGHYIGVEAIWIRVLWILLTIASSGAFILIYIALWIFIPEAKTTADKLAMRGEEVTISNIEKKIRESFDNVSGKVRNVDYEKYGHRARSGARSAATTIGDIIMFIITIFVKLIGILLLLVAGSVLIGLFIGLIAVGAFGIIDAPWSDYIAMATSGAPLWLLYLLSFFAVGIPFFFLFTLGLKILVQNLKTIGTTAKLVLLGIWLLSIIGLVIIGLQQATARAFDGEVVITETLPITPQDTLFLAMQSNPEYSSSLFRQGNIKIKYDSSGNRILYGTDIRLIIKSTKDSLAKIEISKTAEGKDYNEAKDRADNIGYSINFADNKLLLDGYFTTPTTWKYRDQKVQVMVFLPEGSKLFADENTHSFHRNSDYYGDILNDGEEEKYLEIIEDATHCPDCPDEYGKDSEEEGDEDFNARLEIDRDEINIRINKEGVKMERKRTNQQGKDGP